MRIEGVRLSKISHLNATAPDDVAVIGIQTARYEAQKCRLSVSIFSDDANAVTFVDADGLVKKNSLARPFHRKTLAAD
jgi:hypothetical protein